MKSSVKPLSLLRKISYQAIPLSKLSSKLTGSQPKLRSYLSVSQEINVPKIQLPKIEEDEPQVQQNVWNQLLSESSEFEIESTNMAQVFAKFNSNYNDFLPLTNMIRQNINGLEFKSKRLDDLLILASSHQAVLDNIINKQMQIIVE
ncbi:Hypothetical_protein [Hexamita inflata]|uniref:Hypothetical_protein n=1 Tax=Hexamita inflata TaxID=28002 RepID=A0AA86NL62_9EUKA|nr:Hypothetical protein HINF_LOCUS9058 [Hexamita inflata]